ncbi:MAG: cytidylate kinase-like family protein [Lachnospiraceae bacterium]|nr:cytidylate kinase-like family protein [Lachnospiraceae bacterium]
MRKVITISREFGAGGGEIGRAVASELGYEYYDKAIILRAAKEANIDVESVYRWDESVPVNFGFAQSLFDFYNKPLNEKLFDAQKAVIRQIGEKGNCVIVGRNANAILSEFDRCLHVFVCADAKWRKERALQIYPDMTKEQVADQLASIDKRRKKYCSYYTKTQFGVADYYDLCLRTSELGIEKCVKIICDLARSE